MVRLLVVADGVLELVERKRAGMAPDGVTATEKHKRWNGQDTVHRAEPLLRVEIDLQDANLVAHVFFQLFQNRVHRLTWTAPCGVEIYQCQLITGDGL